MRIHLVMLALLINACVANAQEHDATFKLIKKEYTLNPDESISYTYTKVLKLHTQYAFNRMYGETFVIYNPDYQKLDIEYAYTVMADGKRVDCPKNAFNEVLPKAAAAYPAYNNMREMVITHTALEPGCTIHLKYKITSHAKYITQLMGTELLQEEVPVEKEEIVLSVPGRRGLKYKLLNSDVKVVEAYRGDLRTHTFTFNNLKASKHYPYSSKYTEVPTLIFSTYADMSTALEQWKAVNKLQKSEIPMLNDKISVLRKSTFDMFSLARKIQAFVIDDVSAKSVPMAWRYFVAQTAQDVWGDNVGNEFEKTRLLWQALLAADMSAEIVAFVPRAIWKTQIGDLNALDKFGVKVSIKGVGEVVLSAVHLNPQSLELSMPTYKMIGLNYLKPIDVRLMAASCTVDAQFWLDLGQDLRADITLATTGAMNKYLQWANKPSVATKSITNWELKEDDKYNKFNISSSKSILTYRAVCKNEVQKEGDYYFWQMPHYQHGIAAKHYLPLLSKRNNNMVLPAIRESYNYKITLPKSAEWVSKPVNIHQTTDFGEMNIDIHFEKGQLLICKSLVIRPQREVSVNVEPTQRGLPVAEKVGYRIITPEQYKAFRKMMIDWFSEDANRLIFRRM